MAILVTGGAGYVGRNVVLALVEAGEKVVVVDNLVTGSSNPFPSEVEFVNMDFADFALQSLRLREFDTIMHLAALINVAEAEGSEEQEKRYWDNNVNKSLALIREAARAGVKHFIFSSTAAVYGDDAPMPVSEEVEPKPTGVYGKTKKSVEDYLSGPVARGMSYISFRYFNVAGADPQGRAGYPLTSEASHLIRKALLVARGKLDHLPVYGTDYPTPDGTGLRDYVHVSDVAQAHLSGLLYLRKGGESQTLNVGYGRGYSVIEVHQAAQRVTGKIIPLQSQPRRKGDVGMAYAKASRIRKVLKWKPLFANLDLMIRHQWEWELSQENK